MPTHTTDKLQKYRQRLEKQFRDRKKDRVLRQRAWATAHRVAEMLYTRFGASQVAVFGSLAEGTWFSEASDIDFVVSGLNNDTYLEALWETRTLSQEFKIDVVNFESTKGRFRERIQKQAVPIKRTETASQAILTKNGDRQEGMDRQRLSERIVDERKKIEKTVAEIRIRLQRMESASDEDMEDLKALIAMRVLVFYTGLEKIFQRIAREIDTDEPQGGEWHKALLTQMSAPHSARPPVISEETAAALGPILRFRHRTRHLYIFELEPEGTAENGHKVCELFDSLATELDTFIAYLEDSDLSS